MLGGSTQNLGVTQGISDCQSFFRTNTGLLDIPGLLGRVWQMAHLTFSPKIRRSVDIRTGSKVIPSRVPSRGTFRCWACNGENVRVHHPEEWKIIKTSWLCKFWGWLWLNVFHEYLINVPLNHLKKLANHCRIIVYGMADHSNLP